ncbi:hypothetical protein DICVIV_05067 [Dictyocaulus viviparus]|uniref:Uncharacterized protein n=1 Tax=Dictyocaulus viviparus TaxID=29172 RepID=A0A0D8XYI6_DICVI|nr:hypothetical protein DICVIV_05067 [Dictyocaulus viviparus]
MPTKSAGTPTLLSGKYSPAKYALSFFSHGCCIQTSTVLWLIIVLFIFTVILLAFFCSTITIIRWQYRRTIRNKCDLLRDKYDKEIKTKRETDLKMKEIALKPIHTHHYHQNERPRRPETSRSRPRTPENEKVYLPKPPTFINDDNQINVPYPTHIIQSSGEKIKKGSKDGLTNSYAMEMPTKPSQNLTTNAVAPLDKVMTVAPSGIEAPKLSDVAKPTMQLLHSTSSSAPVACSTTPTTITTKSQDKIKVEPHVIAATSHAILTGGWKGVEKRPIYEGLILLNKDNSKHGKCPTDGSSPHDLRKIEIQSPIIDTGKAFESLVKQISSSDSPLQMTHYHRQSYRHQNHFFRFGVVRQNDQQQSNLTPTSKAVIEMASSLPLPVTGLDVYALRRQKERMTLVRPPVMDLPDDPQVNQTQQSRSPVNRYSNGELVTNGKSLLSRNTIVL